MDAWPPRSRNPWSSWSEGPPGRAGARRLRSVPRRPRGVAITIAMSAGGRPSPPASRVCSPLAASGTSDTDPWHRGDATTRKRDVEHGLANRAIQNLPGLREPGHSTRRRGAHPRGARARPAENTCVVSGTASRSPGRSAICRSRSGSSAKTWCSSGTVEGGSACCTATARTAALRSSSDASRTGASAAAITGGGGTWTAPSSRRRPSPPTAPSSPGSVKGDTRLSSTRASCSPTSGRRRRLRSSPSTTPSRFRTP